jgi:hypothetical protein
MKNFTAEAIKLLENAHPIDQVQAIKSVVGLWNPEFRNYLTPIQANAARMNDRHLDWFMKFILRSSPEPSTAEVKRRLVARSRRLRKLTARGAQRKARVRR